MHISILVSAIGQNPVIVKEVEKLICDIVPASLDHIQPTVNIKY